MMWDNPPSGNRTLAVSRFGPGYSVYALAVSPSGSRLAAGTRAGLLRVHALENHRARENAAPIFEVVHGSDLETGVLGLAFPTDEILASGGQDGRIKLWDVPGQRQLAEIEAHPSGIAALCSLGSLVVASIGMDGVLRVWDLDTLKSKYESEAFELPRIAAPTGAGLTGLDFDPQTGLLLHASRSGELHVYDTREDFTKRLVQAHHGDFFAIACGVERVATAGLQDLELKLWPQTLSQPVAHVSVAMPIVAVGWVGAGAIMTIGQDGSSQFWDVGGELPASLPAVKGDLRTCIGLPPKLVAKLRVQASRQWRDRKITEANSLMPRNDLETRQRILDIIEELRDRGFSAEASLLLADVAGVDNRILWELESRLALAERLGDDEAALPTLYAVGELLERMQEPALAAEYFEKVAHRREDFQDARERIDRLRSHPLVAASPDNCVRGDLGHGELIPQELDKDTVLKKKFRWRVIFDTRPTWTEPTVVKLEELKEFVRAELAGRDDHAASVDVVRATLYEGRQQRDLEWLYVPCADLHPGLAYATEIRVQRDSSRITPYAVFDAGRLHVPKSSSEAEHNEKIREAWVRIEQARNGKEWLAAIHDRVSKGIRRVMASQDDGW